ncbi:MAG: sigma-70 family RNA polymerase sigma factor [Gammaproteobacteria bacterium]
MNPLNVFGRNKEFRLKLQDSRPRLYRLAYAWSHDPVLADDLVQETLAKALKSASQLRNRDALDSWLFGILANCWRDHFRARREMDNIDDYVLTNNVTPETEHEQQHITDRVRRAVGGLPEGQRQVLTLVDLEGFTYAEVADVLMIPIGTVMSRLCRARKTLAERLFEFEPQRTATNFSIRRVV